MTVDPCWRSRYASYYWNALPPNMKTTGLVSEAKRNAANLSLEPATPALKTTAVLLGSSFGVWSLERARRARQRCADECELRNLRRNGIRSHKLCAGLEVLSERLELRAYRKSSTCSMPRTCEFDPTVILIKFILPTSMLEHVSHDCWHEISGPSLHRPSQIGIACKPRKRFFLMSVMFTNRTQIQTRRTACSTP